MRTTWRVKRVTESESTVEAELVKVEWINKNPVYIAMMDEYDDLIEKVGRDEADRITEERDAPFVEEWLEGVQPGDEGATLFETGEGSMKLTITNGPELHAGDDVFIDIEVVATVDA